MGSGETGWQTGKAEIGGRSGRISPLMMEKDGQSLRGTKS